MATEGAVVRRELVRVGLMLAAGTLAAGSEAWFVATRLQTPAKHSGGVGFWIGGLVWAAVWIGMTVSGGAVAAWIAGMLVPGRDSVGVDRVWRAAGIGWAFLPCLMVMSVRGSWWALLLAAVAGVVTVFRVRPLFLGAGLKTERATDAVVLRSLEGLPPMGAPPMRSFAVAVCAQVCVLLAARGWMVWASAALVACVAMLIGWWTRRDGMWVRRSAGNRVGVPLGGIAIVLLMLVLTRWMGGGDGMAAVKAGSKAGGGPQMRDPKARGAGVDYVGVILWPPKKKKQDVAPPPPKSVATGMGARAKPLIIPFDGPYWYFKAPEVGPGEKAHVTFGEPTKANVKSTNWMPLRMEAHQGLGLPIDLDCCREIDVKITNADNRPGRIDIALVLTDTASQGRGRVMLGDEPVQSSLGGRIVNMDRAPVTETLRFAVPRRAGPLRFDEIDVIVQPSAERAKLGSRVAVEQFELVPK